MASSMAFITCLGSINSPAGLLPLTLLGLQDGVESLVRLVTDLTGLEIARAEQLHIWSQHHLILVLVVT